MMKKQASHVVNNAAQLFDFSKDDGKQEQSKGSENKGDIQVTAPRISLEIPENETASKNEIVSTGGEDVTKTNNLHCADSPILPTYGIKHLETFIDHISEVYKCPRSFVVSAVFSAIASACGREYQCYDGQYTNYAMFFMAIIGRSSVNKSKPLKEAYAPINAINSALDKEYKRARELAQDGDKAPKREQIIIEDATPEVLFTRMKENPRGLVGYYDELASKFLDMDRYHKGAGINKELSIFNNYDTSIDRQTGDSFLLEGTYLNQIGGIQPSRLAEFFGADEWIKSGYTSRWLFDYPDRVKYKRQKRVNVNKSITDDYNSHITTIYNNGGLYKDKIITFSNEAIRLLDDYIDQQYTKADEVDNEALEPIYKKANINLQRLALLVHVSIKTFEGNNIDEQIEVSTLQYAIECMEYYEYMSLKIMAEISEQKTTSKKYHPEKLTNAYILKEIKKRYPNLNIKLLSDALSIPSNYIYETLKKS